MLSDRLHLRDIRNTSTFRLTLLFGLVFVVAMAALLALIYELSARELLKRSDNILRHQAAVLMASSPERLPDHVRDQIAHWSTVGINYLELQSAQGEHIVGNLHVAPGMPLGRPLELRPRGAADPIRVLALRTPTEEILLVGRDISPVLDMRRRVLLILLGSGMATLIAVLTSAILLSIRPLRRVRDLQQASRTIAAGDLEARMPVSRRGDELDLFAGTVNAMVEEVGRVVAQVKGVTDAVAHDLRTPLTRVRSRLYRLAQSPGLDAEAVSAIAIATDDLDAVLERFAALLRISELEASGRHAGFAAVDLGRLLGMVHDLYEPLAEERGLAVALDTTTGAVARADEQLLFEAISNLVDNAVKFSPPGGTIALILAAGPVIEVRDQGTGIPEQERRAVLRRFHRGPGTGDVPGTGLGLSVVAAITHLHGFQLELADGAPGLVARILCRDTRPAVTPG